MNKPLLYWLLMVVVCTGQDSLGEAVDFSRDIRPILADKCFRCHGPDAQQREADLRLDTKAGALADQGGYAAFLPGDLENSEAIRRVFSDDADERMPPADAKVALSQQEKELLREWVVQGAVWNEHWAYVPPVRPELPELQDASWPRNAIDRFVLARLEQEGLRPSPAASRETLVRRVTLDLTGLSPTLDEVDAFLSDSSPDAYEKVVDRLLSSTRYGERMAWPWLDAARYADTDGFQGDPTREMWPWRDWLINALNDNLPFDQFTIQMLAGDLLPGATQQQVVASGFNRNHMFNGEGGRIAEETRVENVFDRTETTSTVWLGLTMTCARCHDHKYDPVSQQEYYQLYAFFNNTSESGSGRSGKAPPVVSYLPPEQGEKLAQTDQRIAALRSRMDGPWPEIDRAQAAWEREKTILLAKLDRPVEKVTLGEWHVLGTLPAPGGNGAKAFDHDWEPEKGVDLNRKYADGKIAWRTAPEYVDGQVHPLPETVGATYLYRTLDSPDERAIDVSLGSDDGVKLWLNGIQLLSNNVTRGAAADQEQVALPLRAGKNEVLLKIVNTGGIAGFYFNKTAESVAGLPEGIADILLIDEDARNDAQREHVRQRFRSQHSQPWQALRVELETLENERKEIQGRAATVMVMDELPDGKRRKTSILVRGTYNKPGLQVSEGTPAFLPPLAEDARRDRLQLARWLVGASNPLTARVTVNRYWQLFFGAGLVRTSEDFGRQGSPPSHPRLLDYLATQFMANGWNVKAMHRLIVTSATYRQSSRVTEELYGRDPENRLLARGARYRMPSWMLRDQALALAGLLSHRMGGPSVKPYQPDGIWAEATFGKIRYQPDSGEALYRRSLYVFWRRIVGPTMFFDGGKRQTCEVKPSRTNTPLHALTTLNEPAFVEAARVMAQRVMTTPSGSTEDRIAWAFRLATARPPSEQERSLLARRWELLRAQFAGRREQAEQLLSVGQAPRDATLEPAEHAAWTVVCSLIINLDEVLTRE